MCMPEHALCAAAGGPPVRRGTHCCLLLDLVAGCPHLHLPCPPHRQVLPAERRGQEHCPQQHARGAAEVSTAHSLPAALHIAMRPAACPGLHMRTLVVPCCAAFAALTGLPQAAERRLGEGKAAAPASKRVLLDFPACPLAGPRTRSSRRWPRCSRPWCTATTRTSGPACSRRCAATWPARWVRARRTRQRPAAAPESDRQGPAAFCRLACGVQLARKSLTNSGLPAPRRTRYVYTAASWPFG